jgi:hypothetical protein
MEYIGEYEKELIQKSYKYSIPIQYKDQQINWLQLIDDIETREQLLKKASDLDIDIEDYIDDPVLIKQLIKEEEKLESNYKSNVLSYYYSTRGC